MCQIKSIREPHTYSFNLSYFPFSLFPCLQIDINSSSKMIFQTSAHEREEKLKYSLHGLRTRMWTTENWRFGWKNRVMSWSSIQSHDKWKKEEIRQRPSELRPWRIWGNKLSTEKKKKLNENSDARAVIYHTNSYNILNKQTNERPTQKSNCLCTMLCCICV